MINVQLLALRSFFNFLSLGGPMKWVPPRLVRLRYPGPRFPKFLSRRDLRRLFRAARNLRERFVLEMLYGTGCRSCEFSAIRVEDIDFRERRVRVRSKGPRNRFVMLTPRLVTPPSPHERNFFPRASPRRVLRPLCVTRSQTPSARNTGRWQLRTWR
jgi:integrase/recombinase XerD